jgi:hypothetical protein
MRSLRIAKHPVRCYRPVPAGAIPAEQLRSSPETTELCSPQLLAGVVVLAGRHRPRLGAFATNGIVEYVRDVVSRNGCHSA